VPPKEDSRGGARGELRKLVSLRLGWQVTNLASEREEFSDEFVTMAQPVRTGHPGDVAVVVHGCV